MPIEISVQRLQFLCDTIPPLLRTISDEAFSSKPSPDKWSKKEILGHVIDSAANNHQRFVRVQFEDVPLITYDQNLWNHYSYHAMMMSRQLIQFWELYNRQLAGIVSHIPAVLLSRPCNLGEGKTETLAWVVQDYVRHLEHHLHQLVDYV